jgi:hypothetical protein
VKTSDFRPDYHTQHAPLGAFGSFTLGLAKAEGGFGHALSGPARQNIFVGYRESAKAAWRLLPFFATTTSAGESAFTGEAAGLVGDPAAKPVLLSSTEFTRELKWASDRWQAGPFTFTLFTPWAKTADPTLLTRAAARRAFAPVVSAELTFDNTHSAETAEIIFGLADPTQPCRPLDRSSGLRGFANGLFYGYATLPSKDVGQRQAFDLFQPKFRDQQGLHLLGAENGLLFRVPPKSRRAFPLALGFFYGGNITSGLSARYFYTRLFAGLEEVLSHGLRQHARLKKLAAQRDAELDRADLSPSQRWLIAQATHSYLGSSQLLVAQGKPLWVVNEGEYRMMNTFDLTVDHLFFELEWMPWAVKRTLDLFVSRYAYVDRIKGPAGRRARGGVGFTHDMGVANQFTPATTSAYECRDLAGCFSQMTMEQLVNWVCCAATYAEKTGDLVWLRRRRPTLLACAESLRRRDHPLPGERDGVLKWDSDRCGPSGSEITTYDSLNVSLGQARNNLYLAVKTLAAWLLLERAFGSIGESRQADAAQNSARLIGATLAAHFDSAAGFFPAILGENNRARILPAVEGLVFPLYLGLSDEVERRFPQLFAQLRQHLAQALRKGVCLDRTSGAWKISSTSSNTWFSKIALAQHVTRRLFPEALTEEARLADDVHARFQQSSRIGRFALVDQFDAATGADLGSRYYPRGVTACLWMGERRRAGAT